MGLFNFVKDAGEKLWDAVTGNHDTADLAKVQEHLNKTGGTSLMRIKWTCKLTKAKPLFLVMD